MKKKILSIVLTLCMVISLFPALTLTASAEPTVWDDSAATAFDGGDGLSAETAFEIATAEQLAYLAQQVDAGTDYSGKYFVLTDDIVLNENAENYATWGSEPPDNEWTPIGVSDTGNNFKGIFNGGGHKISGVYVDSTEKFQGLFGAVGSGGVVVGLTMTQSYIKGTDDCTGGIAGNFNGSLMQNLAVTDSVITGNAAVGGIVGNITNSSGVIQICYNAASVSGASYVGGITGGLNAGTVQNCYNTGSVSGSVESIGGIAGMAGGTIKNCYNAGSVNGVSYVGGTLGDCDWADPVAVTGCYYDNELCTVGGINGTDTTGGAEGKSTSDMKTPTPFTNWDTGVWSFAAGSYPQLIFPTIALAAHPENQTKNVGDTATFSVSAMAFDGGTLTYQWQSSTDGVTWSDVTDGTGETAASYTTPERETSDTGTKYRCVVTNADASLTSNAATLTVIYTGGDIEIDTAAELEAFAASVNSGVNFAGYTVTLANDIALGYWQDTTPNSVVDDGEIYNQPSGGTAYTSSNHTPIGSDYYHQFRGTFDGAGHTVSGIYTTGGNYKGLFGCTGTGATVKNVGVTDSFIKSNGQDSYAGGVVGWNILGTVDSCYFTGTVTNYHEPMGYSNGYVGGVVGMNSSSTTVINCYNAGSVSSSADHSYVGGVVGYNGPYDGDATRNCYNIGSVSISAGYGYVGGVVGFNESGTGIVENCYWLDSTAEYGIKAGGDGQTAYAFTAEQGQGTSSTVISETGAYSNTTSLLAALNARSPGVWAADTDSVNGGYPVFSPISFAVQLSNQTVSEGSTATFTVTASTTKSGGITYQWEKYNGSAWEEIPGATTTSYTTGTLTFANSGTQYRCVVTDVDSSIEATSNAASLTVIYAEGNLQIGTAAELEAFAATVNSGVDFEGYTVTLTADIALGYWQDTYENGIAEDGEIYNQATGGTAYTASNHMPIGWYDEDSGTIYGFNGTFDGAGHTVSGIYIKANDEDNKGLFGYTDTSSVVKNVGVVNSYICGKSKVGGVVGYNNGTAQNCYNTSSIIGRENVGGVVGVNNNGGIVKDCYNTGAVSSTHTAYRDAGGIVGENSNGGIIKNCFNAGVISGEGYIGGVGGIAGASFDGEVENCYNIGELIGSVLVGGIVGENNTTVQYCYWLADSADYAVGDVGGETETYSFTAEQGQGTEGSTVISEGSTYADTTSLLTALNARSPGVWAADTENKNGGYPVLASYTVTWKSQDGSSTLETDNAVAYGAAPSYDGTAPTKASDAQYDYTFVGWATSTGATSGTAATSLATVSGNVTYYAAFSESVRSYAVSFDSNEGSPVSGQTIEYGDIAAEPDDPTKENSIFGGWYTDNGTFETEYNFATPVTGDITLYAKWTAPVASVTTSLGVITNYGSFADALAAAKAASGSTLKLLENVTVSVNTDMSGTYTFDLNGKTVTVDSGYYIYSSTGDITVIDSGTGGKITKTATDTTYPYPLLVAGGNFTLQSGIIESASYCAISKFGSGTLTISGGTVRSLAGYSSTSGVVENAQGNLVVTGGAITAAANNNLAISNNGFIGTATATISGGTFAGMISNQSNATLKISGGTYVTSGAWISNDSGNGGVIYISGTPAVTYSGSYAISTALAGRVFGNDGAATPAYYTGTTTLPVISLWALAAGDVVVSGMQTGKFTAYGTGAAFVGEEAASGGAFDLKLAAAYYTFTYDAEGGSVTPASKSVAYNSSTALDVPTRANYIFNGWYTGDNGTGSQLTDANGVLTENVTNYITSGKWTVSSGKTVYASWTAKTVISYTPSIETFTYGDSGAAYTESYAPADGFTIEYYVGSAWTETAPTNAGSYDVRITRDEDTDYASYNSGTLDDYFVINPATLTVSVKSGITITKTYDGDATVDGVQGDWLEVNGLQNSETATASGTWSYDTAAVGTGKTVNITSIGINYGTANSANYSYTYSPLSATGVITNAPQDAPSVTIDYISETVSTTTAMEYSLNGTSDWTNCDTNMSIASGWFGGNIYFRLAAKDNYDAGSAQTLAIPLRPATPTAVGTNETYFEQGNGSISGISIAMEYKTGSGSWQDVTGTTLSNLAVNTYYIRVKAVTGTSFKSAEQTVTLTSGNKLTVSFDSKGGSAVSGITDLSYNALISAPTAPTKTANTFAGWYKEESLTTPWSFATDRVTANITLYASWTAKTAITYTPAVETFTYGDSGAAYTESYAPVDGFTIEYYVGSAWTETAPTNAGSYDVRITRDEDTAYASYNSGTLADYFVISPATLTVAVKTGLSITKTYDGDTTVDGVQGDWLEVNGLKNGETATASGSWSYENADAGTGKTVNITGISISYGTADSANYTYISAALSTTGAITNAPQDAPSVTIDYINETVSTTTAMEYSLNGTSGWTGCTLNMAIASGWFDSDVYFRLAAKDNYDAGDTQTLAVPARPATPTATGTNETSSGQGDGSISGIDATMEYKLEAGSWTDITGTSLTGLSAGTYAIRVKATGSSFRSLEQTVVLAAGSQLTVTFDSNGGSTISSQNVNYNALVTEPSNPARAGYAFGGWFKEAALTTEWVFATDTVTVNITLYAQWTAEDQTLTFDGNGSTSGSMPDVVRATDTAANLPTNAFIKAGHTFTGWNTEADGAGTSYADEASFTMPAGGDILYAQWTAGGLTGTAGITGDAVYGQTLTATLSGGNNTGTLSYQWKRGTTDIGTNSNEYIIAQADIGYAITVTISSSVQTGTLTSAATSAVEKADCATATGATPALDEKTHNRITVTAIAGYEYLIVADGAAVGTGTWQNSSTFTGLSAGTAYDIYQRVKETATHKASGISAKLDVTTNTGPALAPASCNYDLNAPADVTATITWNGAASVTNVVYIISPDVTPYTLNAGVYHVDDDVLIIENSFFSSLSLTTGTAVGFEITFDTGATATLMVHVVDGFVPVTGITGVPNAATAGTPLTLTGTAAPADATNRTIVWSVHDAGGTGATIAGGILSASAAGAAVIRATIVNGLTASTDYTQDFTITVSVGNNGNNGDGGGGGGGGSNPPPPVEKTITVTETSSSLFRGSTGKISAAANMENAFSNSVEVKITDTTENAASFGLGTGGEVYPFDISLYIKGTNTKTRPADGYAVTISLPVPEDLLDVKELLSVVHKSNDGKVTTLTSRLVQIDGVWYLVFEATEFSPYALVVRNAGSYDESAGVPYYLDSVGNRVFIGFAANGKYIAPEGVSVLIMQNDKSFTDVSGHWAAGYIGFVTEREIFLGTGTDIFSPNIGMSRVMFATVIGRLYERSYGEIEMPDAHAFTDCDYSAYYGKYVDWAAENGIISGYGDGRFGPDDRITREQMAAILYRFAGFLGVVPASMDSVPDYPDAATISEYAAEAALYCQTTGVIGGRDAGFFAPRETATRAEVATIIERFVESVVN
jgi:uncharacterized repeat protein (TIGR02543 family)